MTRWLSLVCVLGLVGLCTVATWLSTDRTQFFMLVLGLFFMYVFSRGTRLSWFGLAGVSLATAALLATNFLVVGALVGKTPARLGVQLSLPDPAAPVRAMPSGPAVSAPGGPSQGSQANRFASMLTRGSTLYLYASGSYGALNTLLEFPLDRGYGLNTAYPVFRALQRMGVLDLSLPPAIPANSPLRLQSGPDIQFNGYTYLLYPLLDFGVGGAIAYAGVTGVASGLVYGWCRRRRRHGLALTAIAHLSIALALSIFVNKFNNTASWYIALMSLMPFVIARASGKGE